MRAFEVIPIRRRRRRAGGRRILIVLGTLFLAAAYVERADAASVAISVDTSDPVEQEQVSLTISGTSPEPLQVVVWAARDSGCEETPADTENGAFIDAGSGEPVSGDFAVHRRFTPDEPGNWRVCAWLTESSASDPEAVHETVVAVEEAPARVADIDVEPSRPRPERAVTVKIEGKSDVPRKLVIWVGFEAGCPEVPADAEGGEFLRQTIDDTVEGRFTKERRFTPDKAGNWWVCAWLTEDASADPVARLEHAVSVAEGGGELEEIEVDTDDPVEQEHITLTIRGKSDVPRRLEVWAARDAGCEDAPGDSENGTFVDDDADKLVSGHFTRHRRFMPDEPGNWRVCAWLVDTSLSDPVDKRETVVVVEEGRARFTDIDIEPDRPRPGREVKLKISGRSQVELELLIWVGLEDGCAEVPAEQEGGKFIRQTIDDRVDGGFTKERTFLPDSPGNWWVCAWLGTEAFADPAARLEHAVSVLEASGTLEPIHLDTEPPVEQQPVSLTIRGTSEEPRRLEVWAAKDAGCEEVPGDSEDGVVVDHDADDLVEGDFTRHRRFVPDEPGNWRVCAWLVETSLSDPLARRETVVVVEEAEGELNGVVAQGATPAPASGPAAAPARAPAAPAPALAAPARRTTLTARFPAAARAGKPFRVAGRVRSAAGAPTGRCTLERIVANRWTRIGSARVTSARTCAFRVLLRGDAVARLRIRFRPSGAWLPSVTGAAAVRVGRAPAGAPAAGARSGSAAGWGGWTASSLRRSAG